MQAHDPISTDVVERALRDVLARGEEPPSLLEELFQWFNERVGIEPTVGAMRIVFWIVGVTLVALLIVFLVRAIRSGWGGATRGGHGGVDGHGASVAERVAALRFEATEARARGELRLALRKQFFALVLGLGGRGDLHFRDAWTNREVLARGAPSAEVDRLLTPLVIEMEAKEFGREAVSESDLDRLERLCVTYLGEPA